MSIKMKICKKINSLFPLPPHPFNLQNDGVQTYAQWQFEKGEDTIKFYLEYTNIDEMFKNKTVLDIGCGAAGKTLYYASKGVKKIYGAEILKHYEEEAYSLAMEKKLEDKFEFVACDASKLPFSDNFFDTIIMNDSMEHVKHPMAVLNECHRVLKSKGKLYINFPPYYHPYGSHLSDAIGIPWVHCFFSEKTLIDTYKDIVSYLPDGEERINFRISKNNDGKEYFSYINKMTIKRFKKLLSQTNYRVLYYKEVPLRNFLQPFASSPIIKEGFVKMVVSILEKQ